MSEKLYYFMAAGLLMLMAPVPLLVLLGFVLSTGTLIYSNRKLLPENWHRQQLSRLYWRGMGVISAGVLFVAVVFASNADTSAIQTLATQFGENTLDLSQVEPALEKFKADNMRLLAILSAVAAVGAGGYIIALTVRGVRQYRAEPR